MPMVEFECKCGNKQETFLFPGEDAPKIICEKCSSDMNKNNGFNPNPFYTNAETDPEDDEVMEWVNNRMKIRPSGREKVLF